jgi:hypothetical protein
MSERLQSGLHLDAEILNAFAEGALPAYEREQALAHLAVCADCREIVFLAEQAQPVPAADTQAESRWQRWLRSAPMFGIGIGAAALAGALIFALTLRTHRAAPPTVAPQTASAHLPAPSLQPEPAPSKVAPPPRSLRVHPPAVNALEPSPLYKPVPQPPTVDSRSRESVTALNGRGYVGSGYGSAAAPTGGMGSGSGAGAAAGVMPITPTAAPPTGAADAAPQSVSEMVTVDADGLRRMTVESAHDGQRAAAAGDGEDAIRRVRIAAAAQQSPRSYTVVSSGSRTLAADSAGALFLSLDAGQHWTRVASSVEGQSNAVAARSGRGHATERTEQQLMDSDEARASAVADYGSRRYLTAGRRSSTHEVARRRLRSSSWSRTRAPSWVSSDGLHWQPAP